MNNAVHGKAIESMRNSIDVRLLSNKKDYLKSKPSYISQKYLKMIQPQCIKVNLTLTH